MERCPGTWFKSNFDVKLYLQHFRDSLSIRNMEDTDENHPCYQDCLQVFGLTASNSILLFWLANRSSVSSRQQKFWLVPSLTSLFASAGSTLLWWQNLKSEISSDLDDDRDTHSDLFVSGWAGLLFGFVSILWIWAKTYLPSDAILSLYTYPEANKVLGWGSRSRHHAFYVAICALMVHARCTKFGGLAILPEYSHLYRCMAILKLYTYQDSGHLWVFIVTRVLLQLELIRNLWYGRQRRLLILAGFGMTVHLNILHKLIGSKS